MNTALVSLALAGIISAPSWQPSYATAQKQAIAQKKPLAVVFGTGSDGWSRIVREPSASPQVAKLLADQYVCVYVDINTADGSQLAKSFAISNGNGLVISDRTGSTQAFWHQGDLPSEALSQYLYKFADPNLVVTGTETVNTPRFSYYPQQQQQQFVPQMRTVNC